MKPSSFLFFLMFSLTLTLNTLSTANSTLTDESTNVQISGDPQRDGDHPYPHDPRPDRQTHTLEIFFIILAIILTILSLPILHEKLLRTQKDNIAHRHFVPNTMLLVAAGLLAVAVFYLLHINFGSKGDTPPKLDEHLWPVITCGIALLCCVVAPWWLHSKVADLAHNHTLANVLIAIGIVTEFIALLFVLGVF